MLLSPVEKKNVAIPISHFLDFFPSPIPSHRHFSLNIDTAQIDRICLNPSISHHSGIRIIFDFLSFSAAGAAAFTTVTGLVLSPHSDRLFGHQSSSTTLVVPRPGFVRLFRVPAPPSRKRNSPIRTTHVTSQSRQRQKRQAASN